MINMSYGSSGELLKEGAEFSFPKEPHEVLGISKDASEGEIYGAFYEKRAPYLKPRNEEELAKLQEALNGMMERLRGNRNPDQSGRPDKTEQPDHETQEFQNLKEELRDAYDEQEMQALLDSYNSGFDQSLEGGLNHEVHRVMSVSLAEGDYEIIRFESNDKDLHTEAVMAKKLKNFAVGDSVMMASDGIPESGWKVSRIFLKEVPKGLKRFVEVQNREGITRTLPSNELQDYNPQG